MNEIWKDIEGYELFYQISNLGNIKSKDRVVKNNKGSFIKKGKLLKPQPNSRGYLRIQLKSIDKKESLFVHRLVAIAFIPKIQDKNIVNHIDSNFLNNKSDNLEWVTHKENIHHAMDQGRFTDSFSKTLDKFKTSRELVQRKVIGTNINTGEIIKFDTVNDAGRYFGNAAGDICWCCKGKKETARGYKWQYEKPMG